MTQHAIIFDTIHILTNETIWTTPDTIGRQYPLKTTHRETGSQRLSMSENIYQTRDTIYISTDNTTDRQSSTVTREPKTTSWLPWLIIIAMILTSLTILAIRIFLIK